MNGIVGRMNNVTREGFELNYQAKTRPQCQLELAKHQASWIQI